MYGPSFVSNVEFACVSPEYELGMDVLDGKFTVGMADAGEGAKSEAFEGTDPVFVVSIEVCVECCEASFVGEVVF